MCFIGLSIGILTNQLYGYWLWGIGYASCTSCVLMHVLVLLGCVMLEFQSHLDCHRVTLQIPLLEISKCPTSSERTMKTFEASFCMHYLHVPAVDFTQESFFRVEVRYVLYVPIMPSESRELKS